MALTQRCAAYPFALDHLVAAEPERIAADADVVLTQFQQRTAANQVVPLPRFAALSGKLQGAKRPPAGRPYCGSSTWHWAPARARRAIGIRPGSGANVRSRISPVVVGDSMINRSAAVTSSSAGQLRVLLGGHQIELDRAAAGGAIVDRVIGDAVARVERDRRVGLAHRRLELERPARNVVAADRDGEGRVHERHERSFRQSAAGAGPRH